jgi:hypothetical protein
MNSVKAGITAALGTVLITGALFGAGFVVVKKSGVMSYFERPKYVPPPIKALPVVDEKQDSANKSLLQVWEQLTKELKRGDFGKVLQSRLRHRKFEELETFADHVRIEETRMVGGQSVLGWFYSGLDTPSEGEDSGDAKWNAHLALIEEWEKAYPDSITPRIAHAEVLKNWAWYVRTGKFAREVSDEQWKLFRERMMGAVTILLDAKDFEPMDPSWFSTMLNIGRAQSWRRSDYMKVFDAGVQFDPTWGPNYYELSMTLLPQWGGKKGEWSDTLEAVTSKQRTEEAYAVYHRTFANVIFCCFKYEEVESDIKKHWPEIKRGYHARDKLYGLIDIDTNDMARMAYIAGDREEARAAIARFGKNVHLDIWDNDKKLFEKAKAWANEN